MKVSDTFNKMKEENKRQEKELTNKIIEGNETLTNTLDKIKNNMEKNNIDSKMQYQNFIQNKQETAKNEINNNMLIQEPGGEENRDYEKNMNFPVQYPKYNYDNNNYSFMKKINTNSNQFVSEQQFPSLSEQDIMSNNQLNNPQQTFNIKPNQEKYIDLNNEDMNNQNNDNNIIQESIENNKMNNTSHMPEKNEQYIKNNGNKNQNIQNKINPNQSSKEKITNNNFNQPNPSKIIENKNYYNNIGGNVENNNNNNLGNKFIPNYNEEIQNSNYQNTSNFDTKNQFNDNFNQTNQSSNFGNVSQQGFTNTSNSTNHKITNSQLNNTNNLTNRNSDKENYYSSINNRVNNSQNQNNQNEFYETNKNINSNQSTGNNINKNNNNINQNKIINNENREYEKRQNDNFYNTNNSNLNPEEKLINAQKEYLKVKTEIDILKKERDYIERKLLERPYPLGYIPDYEKLRKKAKLKMRNRYNTTSSNNNNRNSNRNKLTFGSDNLDKKIYKKKVLNQLADAEIYSGIGSTREILEGFVDRCVERSLYVYRNKHCHTCAKLLALGKSTSNCPKCHNLFEYPVNSKTSRK